MAAKPRKSAKPAATPTTGTPLYQLKITLLWSEPLIWRRVTVPANMTFGSLHDVIQIVMGWKESHLHHFLIGKGKTTRVIGVPAPEDVGFGGPTCLDESEVVLGSIIKRSRTAFGYEYDFGDSWLHEVLLEKILPPDPKWRHPVCVAGAMACPPEDCGGIDGYYGMLEAVADPEHPDHEDLAEWLGGDFDPKHFDCAEVNRHLADWQW